MTHGRPSPGVRIPPPLLFVSGFVAGLALDRWLPWALGAPLPLLGGAFVAAGLALGASAILTFRLAGTAILPHCPATCIVARGPYRFTRNPMYVGLTLAYLGAAALAGTAWPLLALPLVLRVLWLAVVRKEERYLARAFGTEYEAYCRRVRRWL